MTDTAPLTDQQHDAIRQRVPNHYPAPWRFEHGDDGSWSVVYPSDSPLAGLVATVPDYGYDLAEFLAHVRVDVPALLAEVDRLRAELAAANTERETARAAWRRLKAGLIAHADLLDVPFSNAPTQSPWKCLKAAMRVLDDSLKPRPDAAAPTT